MANQIEIQPINGPVDFTMQPPGSKSITNRALLCAALAKEGESQQGVSILSRSLKSDDTIVMINALKELGLDIRTAWEKQEIIVTGSNAGDFENKNATIEVNNSGTSIRFLTAALAMAGGSYRLQGVPRMHQRPIGPLVEALNGLGCNVVAESAGGCPPVTINNPRIKGGRTIVNGDISSQYLSGLLMAAPLATEDVVIDLEGELVSKTYVEMTIKVMKKFHVTVESSIDYSRFMIAGSQEYSGGHDFIEPDASAASYFWAAAAICGGTATVTELNKESLQGDVQFVECLKQMGCKVEYKSTEIKVTGPAKTGIDIDMSDISDTAQTLAVVAMFVEGPTRIRGIAHNRVKETDRIGNLAIELRKLGAEVTEHEDGLTITPGSLQPATIETYDDHRMAMSLSLAGLRQSGVVITDPGCVSKTYPDYFKDFESNFGAKVVSKS